MKQLCGHHRKCILRLWLVGAFLLAMLAVYVWCAALGLRFAAAYNILCVSSEPLARRTVGS